MITAGRQCTDYEWECDNSGQTGVVPDCIKLDRVCDGTPQCVDGSDESNCKVKGDLYWQLLLYFVIVRTPELTKFKVDL